MIIYNNKYYNINTYNINKCTLILLLEDNKYIPVSKIFNNIEINDCYDNCRNKYRIQLNRIYFGL